MQFIVCQLYINETGKASLKKIVMHTKNAITGRTMKIIEFYGAVHASGRGQVGLHRSDLRTSKCRQAKRGIADGVSHGGRNGCDDPQAGESLS